MIDIDEVIRRFDIERIEVQRWIELSWVAPQGSHGAWRFDDCDLARVRLICELRRDMMIDEEAMPVVLSLLDQLYAARRQLALVRDTLAGLPEPLRVQIEAHLAGGQEG
jgi:chaperone modulatory protein CbpM